LFCQNFENFIYFITLCRIFVIIIKLRIPKFFGLEQTLKFKNLRPKQSRHTKLSHKHNKNVFIIFDSHYLLKFSELKKPSAEFKIYDLITYSTVCCRIWSGSTVSVLPPSLWYWAISLSMWVEQCIFKNLMIFLTFWSNSGYWKSQKAHDL